MKRILVVGLYNNLGGMEVFFNNYYNYLYNSFHFDFVTCDADIIYGDKYRSNGSHVFVLPPYKKNPIKYYKELNRIMKDNKYDLVYVNMLSAANVIPIKVAKKNKIKIITHSHSSSMKGHLLKKIFHYINRRQIINNSDVCLACSEFAGNWLYSKRDFQIINNAIDTKKYMFNEKERQDLRRQLNIKEDCFILGNVARFSDEKNHFFMIKLIEKLSAIDKDISLLLIGDGKNFDAIKEIIIEKNLSNNVIMTGAVNDANRYYNVMDIFILPSLFEGLSLVAIEAQTNGLRCVFSKNVNKDTDINNKSLFLGINDENIEEWVQCILNLKKMNNNERITLTNNQYNIEKNVKILKKILDNC